MELADVLNQIIGTLIVMAVLVLTPTVSASKPIVWLRGCPVKIRACAESDPARRFTSLPKY